MDNLIPSDTVLHTAKNIISVISLPRTGTKSLSKCLYILGYNFKHCPSDCLSVHLTANTYQVYADTPMYCPTIFSKLVKEPSNKFIYIDRDPVSWITSFENTGLHNNYMNYMSKDYIKYATGRLDKACLIEIFKGAPYSKDTFIDAYNEHKENVLKIIPSYQLLMFKFEEGWENLCQFLGKSVPDQPIPHINKGTLYEKI